MDTAEKLPLPLSERSSSDRSTTARDQLHSGRETGGAEPGRSGADRSLRSSRVIGKLSGRGIESPQALFEARQLLSNFVSELEGALYSLRSQSLTTQSLTSGPSLEGSRAEQTLRLLRKLVSQETPAAALEEGIGAFFAKLGGFSELESDVRALYVAAHELLRNQAPADRSGEARLLATLEELIAWYARRAETILLMRHELRPQDEEGIFDIQITPHSRQFGVDGVLVTCRATVAAARRGDAWLKVYVRRDGKLLAPAPGWQYWVDDTDAFRSPKGATPRPEGVLCVASPVVFPAVIAARAVQIFDRIQVFLPHGALGLSQGIVSLDLEVELTTGRGPICTETAAVEFSVPPLAGRSALKRPALGAQSSLTTQTGAPYPPPHALGIWSEDLGTGSCIRNLTVDQASVGDGWRGSQSGIRVSCGLSLVGLKGKGVTLEYRLLQNDGRAVGLRAAPPGPKSDLVPEMLPAPEGSGSSLGSGLGDPRELLSSVTLYPDLAVSRFDAVEVRIPLSGLDLPAGNHELVLEVAALDPSGRVICGVGAPLSVSLSEREEPSSELVQQFVQVHGGGLSHLSLVGVEVAPNKTFEGRSQVRVCVGVEARFWEDALFMVEVQLQLLEQRGSDRSNATAHVSQRIWIGGAGEDLRRVVANFDYAELLARLPVDTQKAYRLAARVTVRDRAERIITERVEPFHWSAAIAAITMPEPHDPQAPVVVVDLQSERLADGNAAVCSVTMNVNARFRQGDQAVLYYEVLDGAEQPIVPNEQRHGLPGSIVRVDLAGVRRFGATVPGSVQITTVLQCSLEAGSLEAQGHQQNQSAQPRYGRILRLMLLNAKGGLLQVLHHPLVQSDSELARRQEVLQLAQGSSDADIGSSKRIVGGGMIQRLTRFFRRG